jgi:hypothetical protein
MRIIIGLLLATIVAGPALASRPPPPPPAGPTFTDVAAQPAYQPDEPKGRVARRAGEDSQGARHHRRTRISRAYQGKTRHKSSDRPISRPPSQEATRVPQGARQADPGEISSLAADQAGIHSQAAASQAAQAKAVGALIGEPDGWADGIATPRPALAIAAPARLLGCIFIAGECYRFGSGGFGYGVPYGEWPITHDVGDWGARHGALAINNDAEVYDARLGRHREGMEIHHDPNGRLETEGCVAIEQWEKFKRAVLAMMEQGTTYLHIDSHAAWVSRTPQPLIQVAIARVEIERPRLAHRYRHYAHHHYRHYASR